MLGLNAVHVCDTGVT